MTRISRRIVFATSLVACILLESQAMARNDKVMVSAEEGIAFGRAEGKINFDFYMAGQKFPEGTKILTVKSTRKTNATFKTDQEACRWAFLSVLIALEERAREAKAQAVVNIRSFYGKEEIKDSDKFACEAGTFVAGVTLEGDLITMSTAK